MTSRPARLGAVIAVASFMTFGAASAREIAPAPEATYEALFTPGDDIDVRLASLIDAARSEVLINAFTFTNRRIARALTAAHARGVRVEIVADRSQTVELSASAIPALARSGIAVWLDGNFAAAHNKILIIDGASVRGAVVTGSFNYTSAAQSRNAENVLIVRHDPTLASQYRANFLRLRDRAERYGGASSARH